MLKTRLAKEVVVTMQNEVGVFKQGKVIKVDVQNESHAALSMGGLSERTIAQAVLEGLSMSV